MPIAPPKHRPPGMLTDAQRRARFDKERAPSSQRGYDAAWQKLRREFLKHNQFCKCNERATDVDHIESVASRPDLRLVWSNLRAMCHPCHSRRTARDHGFANPERRRY